MTKRLGGDHDQTVGYVISSQKPKRPYGRRVVLSGGLVFILYTACRDLNDNGLTGSLPTELGLLASMIDMCVPA